MLTVDVDYKCSPSLCYGVGHTVDQFKALQVTINRFAAQLGFAPLTIDGLLGDATLTAATAIASSIGIVAPPTTVDALAANADTLTIQFSAGLSTDGAADVASSVQLAIEACNGDINSPLCTQAKAMCKYAAGTDQAGLPGIADLCFVATGQRKWAIGFGVGLLAATLIGAAAIVYRRRTESVALGGITDPTWVEEKRPGNARAFRRAGFRQVPCADEATEAVMRCWTKLPE